MLCWYDCGLRCKEEREEPERLHSGNLPLRIPPELHRALAHAAVKAEKSVNAYVTCLIIKATGGVRKMTLSFLQQWHRYLILACEHPAPDEDVNELRCAEWIGTTDLLI